MQRWHDQSLFVLLSFFRIMHWIPSQELHSSVSRSVRKGAALTGKGVLVPGCFYRLLVIQSISIRFPQARGICFCIERLYLLAQSVVSRGLVGPRFTKYKAQGLFFLWFTTEGWLSAKSMVRFQQIIYNNHWSLSTANSIASILLYSRSTQSSHSLVKWTISS